MSDDVPNTIAFALSGAMVNDMEAYGRACAELRAACR
jgi:hypothetical protein